MLIYHNLWHSIQKLRCQKSASSASTSPTINLTVTHTNLLRTNIVAYRALLVEQQEDSRMHKNTQIFVLYIFKDLFQDRSSQCFISKI